MKGENDMLFGLFKNNDDDRVAELEEENEALHNRIDELKDLCEEKDSYFTEMISDGLRHGSKLAAKHMSDRKKSILTANMMMSKDENLKGEK
ncbi:MAG: hypothetical protein L6V87_07465 [Ruminococcus sp.]|nr:MAG: hypothetical protein L6V87_07465 [Ruminococcus sp.]